MRTFVLANLLAVCVALPTSSSLWQRFGHDPAVDPLGSHCFDVSADTTDSHAQEWLTANEYKYTSWKTGLCDSSVYPSIESVTHPPASTKVTLRKLGHGTEEEAAVTMMATTGKTVDCRTNKTSEEIAIAFTNAAGAFAKIRGCQDQFACKPYVDCELAMAAGSTETVVVDASFKYFVFTYKKPYTGQETELYPDANLKYPKTYTIKAPGDYSLAENMLLSEETLVINSPSPGNHAHCTELSFAGGKNNAYYQDHGYQYQPPIWENGPCAAKYNWFNRNTTVAPGVVQTELGYHTHQ